MTRILNRREEKLQNNQFRLIHDHNNGNLISVKGERNITLDRLPTVTRIGNLGLGVLPNSLYGGFLVDSRAAVGDSRAIIDIA